MAQILTPGFLKWDGLKFVLDDDIVGGDLSGDVSGAIDENIVDKLKTKPLSENLSTISSSEDQYVLTWDNSASEWQAKPGGSGGESVGFASLNMNDLDQVADQSVYSSRMIKLTGPVTRNRKLTMPLATDSVAYVRYIDNTCTSINDGSNGLAGVVVTVGDGYATVTVPNGSKCTVLIDSRGVTLLTPSYNMESMTTINLTGQKHYYLSDAEINSRALKFTGTLGDKDEDFPDWFFASKGLMIYGPVPQNAKDIIRTTIHCDGFDSNYAFGFKGIYNGTSPPIMDEGYFPIVYTVSSFTAIAEILWTSSGPLLISKA